MLDKNSHKLFPNLHYDRKNNEWESRQEVAFWRGASTGMLIETKMTKEEIMKRAGRFKLAKLSMSHPDLIDAGITNYVQIAPEYLDDIKKEFGIKDHVDYTGHLRYKYLISVDGNSCSWFRLPFILFSGSVLFKQESESVQWFYKDLIPNYHYVPIKNDLSDLVEKIEWARKNDDLMKNISINAMKFFDEHLTLDTIYHSISKIFKEYSKTVVFRKPIYRMNATYDDLWGKHFYYSNFK